MTAPEIETVTEQAESQVGDAASGDTTTAGASAAEAPAAEGVAPESAAAERAAAEGAAPESAEDGGESEGEGEADDGAGDSDTPEGVSAEGGAAPGAPKKKRRRRKKKRPSDGAPAANKEGGGEHAKAKAHRASDRAPFHVGEEVFGKVTAVLETAVMIDLSGKALAIFDRSEMEADDLVPTIGDRFVVRVHNDGIRGGLVVLTRKPLREEEVKPKVEQAHKDGTLVSGLVTGEWRSQAKRPRRRFWRVCSMRPVGRLRRRDACCRSSSACANQVDCGGPSRQR